MEIVHFQKVRKNLNRNEQMCHDQRHLLIEAFIATVIVTVNLLSLPLCKQHKLIAMNLENYKKKKDFFPVQAKNI